MSEEEIIKNVKDFIEDLETDLDGNDETEWTLFPKDLDIIKGLLDLYQQEKREKESIYDDYQDLGKDFYKIQKELEQQKDINEKLLDGDFTTIYLMGFADGEEKWKDKIKEKIEELEKEYEEYKNSAEWEIFDETKYAYNILKELLEVE